MKDTGLGKKLHLGSSVSLLHIIRRYIGHMGDFLRHNTGKKFANLCSVATKALMGKERVNGYPITLQIEVNNICQLKCPGCPTGLDVNPDPKGQISYENFKGIIDQLGDYIYWLELFGFGEPLLNKDIFRIIDYAHKRNIGTVISTNFNQLQEEDIKQLITAGLDRLVISLDGITQETYQKYRQGGNIEKVLHNLELLLDKKDELGSPYPIIEVHFITMEHNRHEIPKATAYMQKLGLNRFYFLLKEEGPCYIPSIKVKDEQERIKQLRHHLKKCHKLWTHLFVGWEGNVRPCCLTFQNAGNIFEQSFKEVWNNEIYTASRRIFLPGGDNLSKTNSPCLTCHLIESRLAYESQSTKNKKE